VAQGEGPEFKLQHCKKKKKSEKRRGAPSLKTSSSLGGCTLLLYTFLSINSPSSFAKKKKNLERTGDYELLRYSGSTFFCKIRGQMTMEYL
jgi:hypothetical protein